jgi:hypothetical protein
LARAITDARPELKSVETMITVGRMGEGPAARPNMPAGIQLVVYGKADHYLLELESYAETEWGLLLTIKEPKLADLVMADLPWREIQIYQDGHQLRGVRELEVEVDHSSGRPVISVEHTFSLPSAATRKR